MDIRILGLATVGLLAASPTALGQSIVPGGDTRVDYGADPGLYDITGGQRSGDGRSLVHDFERFGLETGEIGQFTVPEDVANVVGRVSGGEVSLIDGQLRLAGGGADLFLLNPAGMVFGPNASLALPGSFLGTTADALEFVQGIVPAVGSVDYQSLVGEPTALWFDPGASGAIANSGLLEVSPGAGLTLAGSGVVNAGELGASAGAIVLLAAQPNSRVRLGQPGTVLGYEIDTRALANSVSALELPTLLTGSGAVAASGITVDAAGQLVLAGSTVTHGTTLSTGRITTVGTTGGSIQLLGERVGLLEGTADASGALAGGRIWLGGSLRGQGPLPNAQALYVGPAATVAAAGRQGGDIILWSDDSSRIYGQLSARGEIGGGLIETSSLGFLEVAQAPDVSAVSGQAGLWLLDPFDIEIRNSPGGSVNISTANPFVARGSVAVLDIGVLNTALASGGRVLVTTTAAGQGSGTITLVDPLIYTAGPNTTLELAAAGDVVIDASITPATASDPLDLRLLANTDGLGDEAVIIADSATIDTRGGTLEIRENGVDRSISDCFEDCNDFDSSFEDDFADDDFADSGLDDELLDTSDGDLFNDDFADDDLADEGFDDDFGDDEGFDDGDFDDDDDFDDEDFDDDFDDEDFDDEFTDEVFVEVLEDAEITSEELSAKDFQFSLEYARYLGLQPEPGVSLGEISQELEQVAIAISGSPAVLYIDFVMPTAKQLLDTPTGQAAAQLELVLITATGVERRQLSVTRAEMQKLVSRYQRAVSNPGLGGRYLPAAQRLHDWLIAPIEPMLQQQGIRHLAFVLPAGMRTLPLAALHDGSRFLVERYSLGIMPSLGLTSLDYRDVRSTQVLAMGASTFVTQPELPAVPLELRTIAEKLWPGRFFLNQGFTPEAVVSSRQRQPYGILHLATHGEFRAGDPSNSYIQFWDRRLGLDQLSSLSLSEPPLDLLVLSACRTALGSREAELGFAGLAVQAGVNTAMASLWRVDDVGTAGLMTEFYARLRRQPLRAEALRQAQIAMLRGEIAVEAGQIAWSEGVLPLPPQLADENRGPLSHPFYWAAFTLVGSPW